MAFPASRFSERSFAANDFRFEPEHGTAFESLLDPAAWANVAIRLKAKDIIEVVPESLEWYARLIVVEAESVYARVKVLEFKQLTEAASVADEDENFEVAWKGPQMKWAVIRKQDKAVVFKNLASREAAEVELQTLKAPKAA